jgi:hypothetical protein
MFMCPEGWREWRNGDLMTYVPREGKAHCVITYAERITPVHSLPYLLYRVLEDEPEFVRTETLQIVRFVSVEGEYGARIVVKGESRGNPIAICVAALFTESFSTRIVGRIEHPYVDKYVDMITDLAQHDRLDLGIRRRRVAFQPPTNWHPVPGDLEVSLFPPEYPKPRCVITVYPAEPIGVPNMKVFTEEHDRIVGIPAPETSTVTKIHTPRNLRGELFSTVHPMSGAGKMVRHFAVLGDARYSYTAKLEALEQPGLEPMVETFMNMLGTFEFIPAPSSTVVPPTAVAHWID